MPASNSVQAIALTRRQMLAAASATALPWLTACGGGGEEPIAADSGPIQGLEFPSVDAATGAAAPGTMRPLSAASESELVFQQRQLPSWAYYTDRTAARWYISQMSAFGGSADCYSLGYMVNSQAAWWTVARNAITGSTTARTVTAAARLDADTSTTFWDAGRNVSVTNELILSDRRLVQGSTVPVKWWFFRASNGAWYIVMDPSFGNGVEPQVHRFAARNNQYDWITLPATGLRTLLEWNGTQLQVRFTPVPGYANGVVGQSIDMDGAFGAQCVDLFHHYLRDALGVPFRSTTMQGNAFAIYDNAPHTASYASGRFGTVTFTKMARTAGNTVPLPGDIAFWRSPDPGHVAIVVDADANTVRSVDQNWVNANAQRGSPAARVDHPNNNTIVGWLRPSW